jgi:hypothetical protein
MSLFDLLFIAVFCATVRCQAQFDSNKAELGAVFCLRAVFQRRFLTRSIIHI